MFGVVEFGFVVVVSLDELLEFRLRRVERRVLPLVPVFISVLLLELDEVDDLCLFLRLWCLPVFVVFVLPVVDVLF